MDTDNSGTPNLVPCPLPRQEPTFDWLFVSEVMVDTGLSADQLLRLWEQRQISMWVTLPAGAYRLPDKAHYYHIEQFGPVQISSESLPDMANHGEARIRLVATPPKYDDKWRITNAGQFFVLPEPILIKFERLRIPWDEFIHLMPSQPSLPASAPASTHTELEALPLQVQEVAIDGNQDGKKKVGRPRKVPKYAQTEADRAACALWEKNPGNGYPSAKAIMNYLAKTHPTSSKPSTWKTRFIVYNCHQAIDRYKEQKEQKE